MKLVQLLVGLVLLAPLSAQSLAQLKKELKVKEDAAKNNAPALVEAAAWAKEKGMLSDMRRILTAVLKVDKDNAAANEMLGFVKWEGEWITKAKADALRKKAIEEEMKAKGFVQVEDVWVAKDEAADAKKGVYWHEGEKVTKAEKVAFSEGKVRHPTTGEFISPDDLAKANAGEYPIGDGKWGDEAAADKFHGDVRTPWLFRTHTATIVGNRPLTELKNLAIDLDSAIGDASRIFTGLMPTPAHRPFILIARDTDHYRELGTAIGAEGSAYAVFPALGDLEVRGLGSVRPVVTNWEEKWGPYWLRHAGAMAWVLGVAADLGVELPLWFQRGVGGYAERFKGPGDAQHFGKQHLEKGGVNSLSSWFKSFAINGDMESRMHDYNMFQAGLMFSFAMEGGDEEATKSLGAVTEAARSGDPKKLEKAIEQFQAKLTEKQDAIRDHLRKLVNG
ncbi:MAG: hypothetical protein HZB39_16320 [Planctomycetes bacterium]|nr:hypothetical protein [Planctomycetota bacterium]